MSKIGIFKIGDIAVSKSPDKDGIGIVIDTVWNVKISYPNGKVKIVSEEFYRKATSEEIELFRKIKV